MRLLRVLVPTAALSLGGGCAPTAAPQDETDTSTDSAGTGSSGSPTTGDASSGGSGTQGPTPDGGADACPSLVWTGDFVDSDPTALAGYTEVEGAALIRERDVADLSGMECIDRVGLILSVSLNPNLVTLNGLEQLVEIGEGALRITDNPKLLEIQALSTLQSVGGRVSVQDNPVLGSLEGLEQITRANEIVEITNNDGLVDLRGLDGLGEVETLLAVGENDALTDLQGLEGLEVAADLTIYQNPSLMSVAGLDSIASLGDLKIMDNAVLTDVSALSGAKVGMRSNIEIYDNPLLPQCDAEALAAALQPAGFTGTVDVRDNLGTCP